MRPDHLSLRVVFLLLAAIQFCSETAFAEDLKIACEVFEMKIVPDCSPTYLKSRFEFKIGKEGFDMGNMDSTFNPEFHFQVSYMTKSMQGDSTYLKATVEEHHHLPKNPQNFFPYLSHSSSAGHNGMKLYDSVLVNFDDTDSSGNRNDCAINRTATMVCILAKASDTFEDLGDKIAARFEKNKMESAPSFAPAY